MKRPLILLVGIVFSIIMLSIFFPSDPAKPDILSRISNKKTPTLVVQETVRKYRISDILKVEDKGTALVWSLDEKYLYYSKPVEDEKGKISEEIWFSDLGGRKQRVDTNLSLTGIRDAKWSSDGNMLSFIANVKGDKSELFIYDKSEDVVKNITPKKASDVGVTSYGWDDESQYVVMSVDIVDPSIYLYNIGSEKISKVDLDLKSCRYVSFGKGGKIIFSDMNENLQYRIYSADMTGKNVTFITQGQDFILSPNKSKIAVLSDENSQSGLWVYDMESRRNYNIASVPIHSVYWLENNKNLLYSTEIEARGRYAYDGNIMYLEEGHDTTEITGAVHTIFVSSNSGRYIAMTSPEYMEDNKGNIGVFIGELYR